MGMLKKEQKAKVEGMKFASRLITEAGCKTVDDCIKVIDSEIMKNGGKPNEFGLTSYEIQDIKRKIYERTIMSIKGSALWALRTKFGFGRKRLLQFLKEFDSVAEDFVIGKNPPKDGYDGLQLEDVLYQIRYETGIDLFNEKTQADDYDYKSYLKTNGYYKELAKNRKRKAGVDNGGKDENEQ